jgi:hypothetical protein
MESRNKNKFMISCKEATMIVVKKAEIKVTFSERLKLFLHLIICQYCRLFEKQNKIIDKIVSSWKTNKKLSFEHKNAIKLTLEKEIK